MEKQEYTCRYQNMFHTSKTFFLLDLSFEAQPIVAPRRSTVNSGTIWLVLFCAERADTQLFYETHNNKSCPWQLMSRPVSLFKEKATQKGCFRYCVFRHQAWNVIRLSLKRFQASYFNFNTKTLQTATWAGMQHSGGRASSDEEDALLS